MLLKTWFSEVSLGLEKIKIFWNPVFWFCTIQISETFFCSSYRVTTDKVPFLDLFVQVRSWMPLSVWVLPLFWALKSVYVVLRQIRCINFFSFLRSTGITMWVWLLWVSVVFRIGFFIFRESNENKILTTTGANVKLKAWCSGFSYLIGTMQQKISSFRTWIIFFKCRQHKNFCKIIPENMYVGR